MHEMSYPDKAQPKLLAGVASGQIAQDKVIVVPDDAKYDV